MNHIIVSVLTAAVLLTSLSAAAHSLEDVETELHEQERYAQFVNYRAPDFHLADAEDQAFALDDFAGKVVVLNFIYLRCQEACPIHMALIGRLQSMVNAAGMAEQVQFITIATDTEGVETTREMMRSYGKSFGLEADNWRLLFRAEGAPSDTTIGVAEAYGLQFAPVEEDVQTHGVVTHVIDQAGQMRARFHGSRFEPVNLVSYVNALVNDDHSRR